MSQTTLIVSRFAAELAAQHGWAVREQTKAPMHPLVLEVLEEYPLEEAICKTMALYWPHTSDCGQMVAFTPSPEYGERNRQVKTSIGKFLRKFYLSAQIPDHVLRNLATKVVRKTMELTTDPTEWFHVLKEGPRSCMSPTDSRTWPCFDKHPYRVYDPELGWSMAVRYADDGTPMARALVYKHKYFVRTYRRHADWPNGYSYADETLAVWLEDQGIRKLESWADADMEVRIKIIHDGNCIVAPYLDGDMQCVDTNGVLLSDISDASQGEYFQCGSTSGYSSSIKYVTPYECSLCRQHHPERTFTDEGLHIGRDGDDWVGPCCESECQEVTNPWRSHDTYWVHSNDTFSLVGHSNVYEDCVAVHRRLDTVCIERGPYEGQYALAAECVRDINGEFWYCHEDENPVADHPHLFA
jgi:hypothetical protein